MAKRKKKSTGGDAVASSPIGGSGRLSTDITDAENGFIINVSGETGGKESKYFSKRFISPTREGALVIASSHLGGGKHKGKKKGGSKKRIALKKG